MGSGKLAHGYIFFGEPRAGKFYFAKQLANFLENKNFEIAPRLLQDALILESASGIDAMREFKNFLWQKPIISPKRTVVIDNADQLTPQAQNAILKITEEPPTSALLILIVDQLENLAPTLLSRFQKIYFGLPAGTKRLSDELMKEGEKYANQFLKKQAASRSELIKQLVEAQKEKPELLDRFFEALIFQLQKDPIRNAKTLRSVLHRLFLIKKYNTNKRLQLEAI